MPSKDLIFNIIGIDRASKTFDKVSAKAEGTGSRLTKLGVVGAAGVAAVGVAAGLLAKKCVDKFEEAATATLSLQRVMGGTAQQASRLNFAAEETGISADKLSLSMKFLAKFMQNTSDAEYKHSTALGKTTVHLQAQKKALEGVAKPTTTQKARLEALTNTLKVNDRQLGMAGKNVALFGIQVTDAHDRLLPMNQVLANAATVFQKMPAGAQKTALAVKLFGRSGQELLPFLNRGAAGLKELGIESDKLGHTLSGSQVDAVHKVVLAHRQFSAALSGVEIQLGAALYPALTRVIPKVSAFAAAFAEKAIPVIQRFGVWFSGQLLPALQEAGNRILPGVERAFSQVAASLGGSKTGWAGVGRAILQFIKVASQVTAVVLPVMIRMWGMQIRTYQVAAQAIAKFASVMNTAVTFAVGVFLRMVGTVVDGAAKAFGWVPGLGGKLKGAAKAFDKFRDQVNAALNGIKPDVTIAFHSQMDAGIRAALGNPKLAQKIHGITAFAGGTSYAPGGLSLVGERGPELVDLQRGSKVYTAGQTASMMGGGGGDISVSAPLVIKLDSGVVWQGLVKFKRQSGRVSLGLA